MSSRCSRAEPRSRQFCTRISATARAPDRRGARDSCLVLEAGAWAALGQSALIVGALLVARYPKLTEPRWLGLVMAFGAGALISAVTTDLVADAYQEAGRTAAGVGLLVGAVGYY